MMFSIIPITASAATYSGPCGDNLTWIFDESTGTLTISGTGDMYDYKYNNRPWESYEDKVKSIVVEDGVTSIGTYAFSDCGKLIDATLSDNITSIGNNAFADCINLISVNIPNCLTKISPSLFLGCESLTIISFPDSVTKIGDNAFFECKNLIKVTFGMGLTYIDYNAFVWNENITDVFYPGTEEQWKANVCIIDSGSDIYDAVMHYEYDDDTVVSESFGDNLTWNYDFTTEVLTISGQGDMGDFESTNRPWERFKKIAKKIVINDGIITVGEYAFEDFTKVTDVTISNDVIAIRYRAFCFCSNITEIIIPDSVKTIDDYAFRFCSKLETIIIPDSVISIGNQAFSRCKSLTSIEIPDSVTSIGGSAFANCTSLVSIENIDDIETRAFSDCPKLVSFKVDENNQYYSTDENGVLLNKDKTSLIQYPSGSTQTNYVIPDGVKTICRSAFLYEPDCLESVVIPESVTTLEKVAFRDYKYDLILYYKGTQAQWDELLANNNETSEYLKNYTVICADNTTYPSGICGDNLIWLFNAETNTLTISGTGAMYDYEINDSSGFINQPWYDFSRNIKHIVIEDGVTSIGEAAFTSCDVTDITIGDSVASIGSEALDHCDELTNIIVDEDNQYYSNDEFGVLFNKDKTTLIYYPLGNIRDSYSIPDSVTTIGTNAFDKCGEILASVTIPESVTTIKTIAFNMYGIFTRFDIYYLGTEAEWNEITIESNFDLTNRINIHFAEPEHTHEYATVVTSPTCTENGYTTYTCECGDSYVDDYVNATGHSFGNWTTEIAPTCTETGLEKRVCSACGETETNELSSIGHDYDNNNGVLTRPTETAKGFYTYTCKNDISHITTEEVESADYTEYNKVARKLEEYLSNSNITSEAKSYIMAECVNIMRNNAELYNFSSLTERRDLIASEQYIVDKATKEFNEFFQVVDSAIANCESGNHDVRAYISNDNATCTVNGTKRGACYYCGSEVIVDDENNPALGHDIVVDNAIAPTCTGTGLTEGSHCSRCDGATTEQEVVPALGHSYNPVVTAPTCTEGGYTTYTCACGDSYVDDYVDELGHTEEAIPAVAPTCTTTGLTEGAKCSVCGETLTEQKELPANGHTSANVVEENYIVPTCTGNGSKDVVVYCSVCDEEISRETETIEATGHADNDGDGYCDADNELLDPSVECDHSCHKEGITGFFWRIINVFNMLFGLNKTCDCGVAHF